MKYINYQLCSALHWYQANQHGCTLRSSHFKQESLVLYWWINQQKHADKTAQFLHLYANLHFWFSCSFKIWDEHILNYCLSLFCFQGPTWRPCWLTKCTTPQTLRPSSRTSSPLISMRCLSTSERGSTSVPALLYGIHQCTIPADVRTLTCVCVCTCVKQDWNLSLPLLVILIEVFWFGGFFVCVFLIIIIPLWWREGVASSYT